jgi:hypothetical protein
MGREVVDLVEVVEGEALASAGGEEEDVVLECQQRPIGHCMLRHRWSPVLTWLPLRLFPPSPCGVCAIWWILVGQRGETPRLGCSGKTTITVVDSCPGIAAGCGNSKTVQF